MRAGKDLRLRFFREGRAKALRSWLRAYLRLPTSRSLLRPAVLVLARLQPKSTSSASGSPFDPLGARPLKRMNSRGMKTAAAAAVVVGAVCLALAPFVFPRSTEAITNSPIVFVRSSINGRVSLGPVAAGDMIKQGDRIGQVVNPLTIKTFLMELENDRALLNATETALDRQIQLMEASRTELTAMLEQSRKGMVARLQSQEREQQLRVQLLEIEYDQLATESERQAQLASSNPAMNAGLEAARQAANSGRLRLQVERERAIQMSLQARAAENRLIFESDGSMTILRVHLDELDTKLAALAAERRVTVHKLTQLEDSLRREAERVEFASRADLLAPVSGRIWQVPAATNVFVKEGDEILAIANCAQAMITATVSETTFNGLRVGQHADFIPEGETQRMRGTIVEARGPASGAPLISFAIQPQPKGTKEFQVVALVHAPPQQDAQNCNLGRTGKLVFESRFPQWLTGLFTSAKAKSVQGL